MGFAFVQGCREGGENLLLHTWPSNEREAENEYTYATCGREQIARHHPHTLRQQQQRETHKKDSLKAFQSLKACWEMHSNIIIIIICTHIHKYKSKKYLSTHTHTHLYTTTAFNSAYMKTHMKHTHELLKIMHATMFRRGLSLSINRLPFACLYLTSHGCFFLH